MNNLIRTPNPVLVFMCLGPVVYWLLALFVSPANLLTVFNMLAWATSLMILGTWLPGATEALQDTEPKRRAAGQLVLAVFTLWLVAFLQRNYVIAFNAAGRPDEWARSALSGFWPYSYFLVGLMFLLAPDIRPEGIRPKALWLLAAASALGGLAAGLLIGMNLGTGF